MLSGKTYRILALIGVFMIVAVKSLSAMSCPMHMTRAAGPMHMACCDNPQNEVTPVCTTSGSLARGTACSCQVTPASETFPKAVVPRIHFIAEVTVTQVLAIHIPDPVVTGYAYVDPPDLHPDVPIFLRHRTLLI